MHRVHPVNRVLALEVMGMVNSLLSQAGSGGMTKMTAREIADDIADRIREGDHAPGTRLDYGELAELYGVKRATIKRAMGLVRYTGLVEDHPGLGVFVPVPEEE